MNNFHSMNNRNREKQEAAKRAVDYIQPGMILGLGTGSTVHYALLEIAGRVTNGRLKHIAGVPSSLATEEKARHLGIPLTTLDDHPAVDLTIDGADEVDPQLNLMKGGGGALLREKILIQSSRRTVIIVDESKLSPRLGTNQPLPVEVLPFAKQPVEDFITNLHANVIIRKGGDGENITTDQGNWILDCYFGAIDNPSMIAKQLEERSGVIEHGLFLDTNAEIIVASKDGIKFFAR